jgi:N-acetylglutamate synthase-like GNAT family acetyltransferase
MDYKVNWTCNLNITTHRHIGFFLQLHLKCSIFEFKMSEATRVSEKEIVLRQARKEDMDAVADMLQELAEYEKMPAPKITCRELQRDGFEVDPPAFLCMVAESASDIVGCAIYYRAYSSWEGKIMMLETMYVKPSNRRQGIGKRLFKALAKEAVKNGYPLINFRVLEWSPACSFYESKGAVNKTKIDRYNFYRLTGDALQSIAKIGEQ